MGNSHILSMVSGDVMMSNKIISFKSGLQMCNELHASQSSVVEMKSYYMKVAVIARVLSLQLTATGSILSGEKY